MYNIYIYIRCAMPNSDFSCGQNTFFFPEVAIALRFSFRKYPKSAQT